MWKRGADSAGYFSICFLIFLLPLFFFPLPFQVYEFQKQALLAGFLVLGWLLVAGRWVSAGKVSFIRTGLDAPIFLVFLVYLLSTVFSVSPATSFLGYYGRFSGGLLSLFLYIAWFYLVVNVLSFFPKWVGSAGFGFPFFLAVSASVFFLSLVSVLQYFEVYLFPWDFARQRIWNPGGSSKGVVFCLLIALPLLGCAWWKGLFSRRRFFTIVFLISLLAIFLLSNVGGRLRGIVLPEKWLVLSPEVTLDFVSSFKIAVESIKEHPVFGSGPATFLVDLTRFRSRPGVHQNIRFSRAGNQVAEVLATTGVLGCLAWAGLFFKTISEGFRRKKGFPFLWAVIACLGSCFFYYSTSASAVFFWTVLAFFIIQAGLVKKTAIRVRPVFGLFLAVFWLGFSYLYFGRLVLAEFKFARARDLLVRSKLEEALELFQGATGLNPWQETYWRGFGAASLLMARESLDDPERTREMAGLAIRAGKRATQLNQFNVQNWENLAEIYQNLLDYASGADEMAVESFRKAVQLDPVNPWLRRSLGVLFVRTGDFGQAVEYLNQAIGLEPEFVQARLDLAAVFEARGMYLEALFQLEQVQPLLPDGSDQRARAEEGIAVLKKLSEQPD